MTRWKHARVAWLAVVPLVLLAGWVYLYTHSHAVDTTQQNQTLALLKDLKQLDSDWSVDVLRSHADINPNYDALAAPLARFADGLARLRARASPAPGNTNSCTDSTRAPKSASALSAAATSSPALRPFIATMRPLLLSSGKAMATKVGISEKARETTQSKYSG